MSGGFRCLFCKRTFVTLKPVANWYCSRACWADDAPRRDNARIDRVLDSMEKTPDDDLRDYYSATCSMCNREQSEHVLSRDELKAMRPLPRCGSCGGHVVLVPMLSCAVSSSRNVGRIRTASARPRIRRAG